ncbi:RNA-binding region-containing protein 3 [Phlebotomus argentipes]|uniref:RNA-binding region-containing protein 3 n=1 Tax=Phlebotomus argentipes TaxID=94469 RepID=UPI0028931BAC|nr:RNA-binding region-containing protein 3 [Phlebotomus argentipes]
MEKLVNKRALFIKNFPPVLSLADRSHLLQNVGAKDVAMIGGNCARLTFSTESEAEQALHRLHQMDLMGYRICVTYAKDCGLKYEPAVSGIPVYKEKETEQDSLDESKDRMESFMQSLMAINKNLNFLQPPVSYLRYNYPPPTVDIIRAISRQLKAVPMFYTQVLHIMNRMNLVPPFYEVGPSQEFCNVSTQVNLSSGVDKTTQYSNARDQLVATDESELESEEDESVRTVRRLAEKRKHVTTEPERSKKIRTLLEAEKHKSLMIKSPQIAKPEPSEIFENATQIFALPKKITLKVPDKIDAQPEKPPSLSSSESSSSSSSSSASSLSISSQECAFLSDKDLEANRIPPDQLEKLPVFGQYSAGVPSTQLYVKNIAKEATQDDIWHIFRRYSKRKEDIKIDCKFQGKLRGQAWIKFTSETDVKVGERQVDRALREVHGYILKNKPLHVSYARSVFSQSSNKTE